MTKSAAACTALLIVGLTIRATSAFAQATAGDYHTTVLAADGTVWSWGYGGNGQIGDGTTNSHLVPTQVIIDTMTKAPLSNVVGIADGDLHSLAVKADGTVWAWGDNPGGQLGDGTMTRRILPVQLSLTGVSAVAAGSAHSVALKSDGTVWTWGGNQSGQLGDGTTTMRTAPVRVTQLSGIVAIAAGEFHTLAVKRDGTVWAWGNNGNGQLGDGTTVQRTLPVQVSGLTGVSAVAAGAYHSLALKTNGGVKAWGYNGNGQLGDGTLTQRSIPVSVVSIPFATTIAAGASHSLMTAQDRSLWVWGDNDTGQLGIGTTTSHSTPIQVTGISNVSNVAGGKIGHSVATATDGTVWGWGYNPFGQVGDGTTVRRLSPVLVMTGSAETTIAQARPPASRYGIVSFNYMAEYASAVQSLGVGLERGSCDWNAMEDSRGDFIWGCSEDLITHATPGRRVLLTVNCTPAWAQSGDGCHTLPTDMTAWTEFVQAFIARYSGKDVVLGVFNEPDIRAGNSDGMTAADYCTLFTAAANARNSSVDARFALAGPESWVGARQSGFLNSLFPCLTLNRALAPQDIVTVHWYDGPNNPEPAIPAYVDGVRTGSGGKNDIWISETGADYTGDFSQAGFYNRTLYGFNATAVTRPWLSGLIFYRLWAPSTDPDASKGILDPDTFAIRGDAYPAYQAAIKEVTGNGVGKLGPNQSLAPGVPLYSASGNYMLQYQSDGNLVEYVNNSGIWESVWSSDTAGSTVGEAVMQSDGNFVVYNADWARQWDSVTYGHPNGYLVMQDDGAIYIYSDDGVPLWAINDSY
jgi:alpha-tubulin suppressor-like RCC1 family protein